MNRCLDANVYSCATFWSARHPFRQGWPVISFKDAIWAAFGAFLRSLIQRHRFQRFQKTQMKHAFRHSLICDTQVTAVVPPFDPPRGIYCKRQGWTVMRMPIERPLVRVHSVFDVLLSSCVVFDVCWILYTDSTIAYSLLCITMYYVSI